MTSSTPTETITIAQPQSPQADEQQTSTSCRFGRMSLKFYLLDLAVVASLLIGASVLLANHQSSSQRRHLEEVFPSCPSDGDNDAPIDSSLNGYDQEYFNVGDLVELHDPAHHDYALSYAAKITAVHICNNGQIQYDVLPGFGGVTYPNISPDHLRPLQPLEAHTHALCDFGSFRQVDLKPCEIITRIQSSDNSDLGNGGVYLVSTMEDGQLKNKVSTVSRIRWFVNNPRESEAIEKDYLESVGQDGFEEELFGRD